MINSLKFDEWKEMLNLVGIYFSKCLKIAFLLLQNTSKAYLKYTVPFTDAKTLTPAFVSLNQ